MTNVFLTGATGTMGWAGLQELLNKPDVNVTILARQSKKNIKKLEPIKDKITIINKIKIEDTKEGIATLKKNMSNKATIELVKEIKQYYKQN